MSQPTPYNRIKNFVQYALDHPSATYNAADHDAELNSVETTLDAILVNLAMIQRDDGQIKNATVHPDSFNAASLALIASDWTPRGLWVTATAYAIGDVVQNSTASYVCAAVHTSGTFATDLAAGKWVVIFDTSSGTAAAVSFTPTGTIAAGTVQLAIAEAASEAAQKSANLSDLASALTARANLGIALAAKGSILVGTGSSAVAELAVGAEGYIPQSDPAQTPGIVWVPNMQRSLAPNPFLNAGTTPRTGLSGNDDTYITHRWYALTQTAAISPSTQTLQENGQPTNLRLTNNSGSAQRVGAACILEAKDSQALRGRQVTFRPRMRCSGSQPIRIAVLEWTGTADTVTSDVVRDWPNAVYTANNFFLTSNLTVSGVGAKTPNAATWTDMDGLTVTISSSCNNIILMAWTEGTLANGGTFDIGKVRFVHGPHASDIIIPSQHELDMEFARFHFSLTGESGTFISPPGMAFSTTQARFYVRYPVPMRRSLLDADVSAAVLADFLVYGPGATAGTIPSAIELYKLGGVVPSDSKLGTVLLVTTGAVLTSGASYTLNAGAIAVSISFNADL